MGMFELVVTSVMDVVILKTAEERDFEEVR